MELSYLYLSLLEIIFPRRCVNCMQRLSIASKGTFCFECLSHIEYLTEPICRSCGKQLPAGVKRKGICGDCLSSPPPFTLVRSIVKYGPSAQAIVHGLKYKSDRSVLMGIEQLVHQFDFGQFGTVDVILPVPLHVTRLRSRGWNQALLLAHAFFPSQKSSIEVDWLVKIRNSRAQTTLSGKQRRKNLRNSFAIGAKAQLAGRRVCLVDDVYTTGSTVEECSRVLMTGGAREVLVITLARADIFGGK